MVAEPRLTADQQRVFDAIRAEIQEWCSGRVIGRGDYIIEVEAPRVREQVEKLNAMSREERVRTFALMSYPGDDIDLDRWLDQIEDVEFEVRETADMYDVVAKFRLRRPIEQVYFTATVLPPSAKLVVNHPVHGRCLVCPRDDCDHVVWELRASDGPDGHEWQRGQAVWRSHMRNDHGVTVYTDPHGKPLCKVCGEPQWSSWANHRRRGVIGGTVNEQGYFPHEFEPVEQPAADDV